MGQLVWPEGGLMRGMTGVCRGRPAEPEGGAWVRSQAFKLFGVVAPLGPFDHGPPSSIMCMLHHTHARPHRHRHLRGSGAEAFHLLLPWMHTWIVSCRDAGVGPLQSAASNQGCSARGPHREVVSLAKREAPQEAGGVAVEGALQVQAVVHPRV